MGKLLTPAQIKKELKKRSRDELVDMICDLCKTSKSSLEQINLVLGNDTFIEDELVEAKKRVRRNFFTARGYANLNLRAAKAEITAFKKIFGDTEKLLDLELYYVECGIEFTNALGDINASFYNSMGGMYEKVVKDLMKTGDRELIMRFMPRMENARKETCYIGWGFGDWISDNYSALKAYVEA